MRGVLGFILLVAGGAAWAQEAKILDQKHYSFVFGEERNFRIFLPPGYDADTSKRFPVIYFFHGWSERFNNSTSKPGGYDTGYGGDNIAAFVARNDVIAVRWDGFNPRTPDESYPRPYNVLPVETHRQFPLYFPELVAYIDANFRTLADRGHRATAGLSMGGFMSFWVSGKYPHLVGSASNFMGSSEFFAGPNGFPSEYRHTEMYRNYEGLRTRIVLGSRDFIRWYHRRMNSVWDYTRPHHQHEEFDWEHGTPGMAKTLAFHMAAFREPLPKPSLWHHADLYPTFDVWDYSVSTDRARPGFTLLENVRREGFRCSVREWLPDGRLLPSVSVRVATDAAYDPRLPYIVTDVNPDTGLARRSRLQPDGDGRFRLVFDGGRHEVGIARPGQPVLTLEGWRLADQDWAVAGKAVRLKVTALNKGDGPSRRAAISISTANPGVTIQNGRLSLPPLAAGERVEPAAELVFTVTDPRREVVRFAVRLGDSAEEPVEIPLLPDVQALADARIADGVRLPVWERAVKKADRVVGTGNGDGVPNPGETIAVAVRDGEAYRLAELFGQSPCADLTHRLSDLWGAYDHVGASAKITMALLASSCSGRQVRLFARVQMPDAPEHKLKEGLVVLPLAGADTAAPVVLGARARAWNRLEVDIRDGGRVWTASAVLKRDGATLKVPLNDDGLSGDVAAHDGVFTGLLPNPAPGRYSLAVTVADEAGNRAERAVDGAFEFP